MERVQALSSTLVWGALGPRLNFSAAPWELTLPNALTVEMPEFAAVLMLVGP